MNRWRRFLDAFRGYGVGAMIGFAVSQYALHIPVSIHEQITVLLCLMGMIFALLRIFDLM